jgi:hypothetical protein
MRGLRFSIIGSALLLGLTVGAHAANSNQASNGIQFFPPANMGTGGCNSTTSLMFDGINPAYCGNPPPVTMNGLGTVSFSDGTHTYTIPAAIACKSTETAFGVTGEPTMGIVNILHLQNASMYENVPTGTPDYEAPFASYGGDNNRAVLYSLPSGNYTYLQQYATTEVSGGPNGSSYAITGLGCPSSIPVTVE